MAAEMEVGLVTEEDVSKILVFDPMCNGGAKCEPLPLWSGTAVTVSHTDTVSDCRVRFYQRSCEKFPQGCASRSDDFFRETCKASLYRFDLVGCSHWMVSTTMSFSLVFHIFIVSERFEQHVWLFCIMEFEHLDRRYKTAFVKKIWLHDKKSPKWASAGAHRNCLTWLKLLGKNFKPCSWDETINKDDNGKITEAVWNISHRVGPPWVYTVHV